MITQGPIEEVGRLDLNGMKEMHTIILERLP